MHQFIALLRHIHREFYVLGPDIVPVTFSKYRMICAAFISALCACAAIMDWVQRWWITGGLWLVSAALLVVAFRGDSRLWASETGAYLAGGAIAVAALCVVLLFWHELQRYLKHARRERRKYRRVPGTSGAALPGTGPRPTRNPSR